MDISMSSCTTKSGLSKPPESHFSTDVSLASTSGSSSSPTHSSYPSSPGSSRSSSPQIVKDEPDCYVVTPQKAAFVIYTDSELNHFSKQGSLSDELVNRLVRNTITNMRSATQSLSTPREPTNDEIEDMAKALCKRFPCTRRVYNIEKKAFQTLTAR